jgi:hypothetical protein
MQSETKAEQAVCLHCSETYVRAVVGLRTVAQLKKVPETERAEKLVELEGITREHAEAWLKHNMHLTCEKREAYCPSCCGQLTTWQAKWCRHCRLDWH